MKKLLTFNFLLILYSYSTFFAFAKDDTKVFIAVKQDCSNCNLVAYIYKQVVGKYKTQLVFNNMPKKELKSYFKEVIMLPDTVSHIASDSMIKVLDDFSKGLGAFVYAYKGNECVYAANLKVFNLEKMQQAITFQTVKHEKIAIPDSITFLNSSGSTANNKYYCLYNYTLKKAFIFSLPEYKIESVVSEKDFDDEKLWRVVFNNDTTGLSRARKICTKVKEYIPDYKMVKVEGIFCSKQDVYFWVSIFKPEFIENNGEKDLLVSREYLIVRYNSQRKFAYYSIEPIHDPENKRPPTEYFKNPATYHLGINGCVDVCVLDSLFYIAIGKDKSQTDRPDYFIALYKLTENKLKFVEFYKTEQPKINTFENVSNSFIPVQAGSPVVYFNLSPFYLNIPEKKFTIFSFLPKQDLKLSDLNNDLWFISFVTLKNNQTILLLRDKVLGKFYTIKLQDNYIVEKYRIDMPKLSSSLTVVGDYVVGVDEAKEHIFKIALKNL
jgi:hypothetical protein